MHGSSLSKEAYSSVSVTYNLSCLFWKNGHRQIFMLLVSVGNGLSLGGPIETLSIPTDPDRNLENYGNIISNEKNLAKRQNNKYLLNTCSKQEHLNISQLCSIQLNI